MLPGSLMGWPSVGRDFDQLSRHNITHIISIHESPQPYIPVRAPKGTPRDNGCGWVREMA
uniref:Uncharacterized protein n=1 Tax=Anolis carolinensis TaxID=28377 RepID=H9GUS5_ANOCA